MADRMVQGWRGFEYYSGEDFEVRVLFEIQLWKLKVVDIVVIPEMVQLFFNALMVMSIVMIVNCHIEQTGALAHMEIAKNMEDIKLDLYVMMMMTAVVIQVH